MQLRYMMYFEFCFDFSKFFLSRQITGSYNDYYRDALRFLGCVEISSMAGQL